jgi:hypothetical protein
MVEPSKDERDRHHALRQIPQFRIPDGLRKADGGLFDFMLLAGERSHGGVERFRAGQIAPELRHVEVLVAQPGIEPACRLAAVARGAARDADGHVFVSDLVQACHLGIGHIEPPAVAHQECRQSGP